MTAARLLLIGGTGLVGTRISDLLSSKYTLTAYGSKDIDITDPESVKSSSLSSFDSIILLSAKADVDGCEKDRNLAEQGDAWRMNVLGAKNVASVCKENGKKLIYVSTDFVFDGKKNEGEGYSEDDIPNPVNWYAYTKWQGEEAVKSSGCDYVIARLAYPYRSYFERKIDFVRAIKKSLQNRSEVLGVTDHIFCPTFIDDFAYAIDALIQNDASGTFHTVGGSAISPFDAACMIASVFGFDTTLVKATTRKEYFKDRAVRPYNLMLKNDKIKSLGVTMKSFGEGLQEVKSQILNV